MRGIAFNVLRGPEEGALDQLLRPSSSHEPRGRAEGRGGHGEEGREGLGPLNKP